MKRLTLTLADDEWDALVTMALDAMRMPQDQARWLLREQLQAAIITPSWKGDEVNEIDHEREGR